DKGEWLVHRAQQPGRATGEILPDLIRAALGALPIPKRMRWGAGRDEFVRPVHWVVILHGETVVPARILGVDAGRETRGHRFMGVPRLSLANPAEYAPRLASEGRVVADFDERRARIETQVQQAASSLGCRPLYDDSLLDEVAALVEWPAPIVGTFE